MDEKYIYSVELYHHGIKGMKWGIRRTKEQLGYKISKARKKHAENAEIRKKKRVANREEKRAEKQRLKDAKKKASKPVSEMTLEELQERSYRLSMERQVLSLQRDVNSFNTKEVSAGKRFIQTVGKEVVGPALISSGKKALTEFVEKKLKDRLGLNVKDVTDPLKALKDEAAKLKLERDISDHTRRMNENADAEAKRQNRSQNQQSTNSSSNSSNKSNRSNDDDDVLKGTVFANMPASSIDKSAVERGREYILEWEP